MVLGLFGGVIADALPKRQTLIVTQAIKMMLSFTMFALVVHRRGAGLAGHGPGLPRRPDERRRHADPPGVRGRDGRPGGHPQRRRAQLGDVQRARGSSGRRSPASRSARSASRPPSSSTPSASSPSSSPCWRCARASCGPSPPIVRPGVGQRGGQRTCARASATSGGRRSCCSASSSSGSSSTFGMNFQVVIPPLTEQVLHSGATGYGFLMAASGVGSLVAALYIAFSARARLGLIAGGAIAARRRRRSPSACRARTSCRSS